MNILEKIESLCKMSDVNDTEILSQIRAAIASEQRPDFSTIKDGEHFNYRGIEFVRLGLEQGGVLCVTAKIMGKAPFDEDTDNDWNNSSLRCKLIDEFLPRLNRDDLLPFNMDLIADNGDKSYGKSRVVVGILSCELYRKYRDVIPHYADWVWTCTPRTCNGGFVRLVYTDGALGYNYTVGSFGFAPACIFKP